MNNDTYPNKDYMPTKEGAKLFRITHETFQADEKHALSVVRLFPHQIYKANATSFQLEAEQSAVTFDVLVTDIARTTRAMGSASVRLAILDDDLRPIYNYVSELGSDNRWRIRVPNTPIIAVKGTLATPMDKIKTGYLLDHDDTTMSDLAETPRYEDTKTYNHLRDRYENHFQRNQQNE